MGEQLASLPVKKHLRFQRGSEGKPLKKGRRAVSEIIATLMLMGITVVGGVLAMTVIGNFREDVTGTTGTVIGVPAALEIAGYDTRNGRALSNIGGFHNDNLIPPSNKYLCTTSCSGTPDEKPTLGGTDFIVLHVRNAGVEAVTLSTIYLMDDQVTHSWDSTTAGRDLYGASPGDFPDDGKYSIVSMTSTTPPIQQRSDTVIAGGETVRIIVKLSSSISNSGTTANLDIDETIKIILTTEDGQSFEFKIFAGSVQ